MAVEKKTKLRIAFMGTPEFAVPILEALVSVGHEIICVYTQPPRTGGRGQKEKKTPIHIRAEKFGINVRVPKDFRFKQQQRAFADLNIDCAVVVAYGLILPGVILTAPKLGCLNIHASLLPRWRGAAPIQRAILTGDEESGVTIMQMDEGLDTGAMLMVGRVAITRETTGESLHNTLSEIGSSLIIKVLNALMEGKIWPTDQPEDGVTYAKKLERSEGHIDWRKPAEDIERLIRAFTPWPGSWFEVKGERIKILSAQVKNIDGVPGTVMDDKLTISCGVDGLQLNTVQRAGKSPMTVAEFLRGFKLPIGTVVN
ncbi:MAG TPA: methionyl-tRNA formyltransferase [Rhodospirillales bacterium]|jgi:methionyl-tRNA formyltransferase|nr:methionyl-tRNA formyltransferase [Rhodospirillales bacterium]HIL74697.1 methionyl-tRNA formyltransferase [Rhodospirillales bacterium]